MRPKIAALLALACLAVVGGATPSGAEAITGVSSVGTGYYHGCAVLSNGEARCWGRNNLGQLGIGVEDDDIHGVVPVKSPSGTGRLTGVRTIVGGDYHSCALLTNGQVRCWGYNEYGQLGDDTDDRRSLPVAVRNVANTGNLGGVVQLTASKLSTCALLRSSQVRCWGNGEFGQLGDGEESSDVLLPVAVEVQDGVPLTGVAQVESGDFHTCARLTNGQARCWGDNLYGQVGDGTQDRRLRPVVVRNASGAGPLINVRRISAGTEQTCATITDGTARCWGNNDSGRLGDGSDSPYRKLPAPVRNAGDTGPLRGVAYLDAGSYHGCALLTNGQVRCWGEADYGELGNGRIDPDRNLPVVVRTTGNDANLSGVTQLQATAFHTCVRLQNGQARCWGYNPYGGLGNSGYEDSALPVKVLRPA